MATMFFNQTSGKMILTEMRKTGIKAGLEKKK